MDFGHESGLPEPSKKATHTHLSQTASVESVLLLQGRRVLAETECGVRTTGDAGWGQLSYRAYAAFHCSSRRCLATSSSVWETKREPTEPEEREGMSASIGRGDRSGQA